MRKRVNAGALVTAGRTKAAFKSMAGLSVCVSTVSFGLPWRGFGLFGNWEGRMSAVCFGALYLTGAASYALTHPVRFWLSLLRAVRRSVVRSVLIECARAGRPSMAMMGMRA